MNANRQATVLQANNKERTMTVTASNLIRWAGLSAMAAGILFIVIQLIHPLDVLSSVTTARWAIAHYLGVAMCLLGLLGVTGLYARQVEQAGWLGLVGSVVLGFTTIRRGDVIAHRAWMARGYAIALGAATQMLTLMVGEIIAGPPNVHSRALLMGAAWVINLAIAECAIRKRRTPRARTASA